MSVDLLAQYAAAWADGRATTIAAFWDAAAFRFYKAEEVETVFTDWAAAEAYWRGNEKMHEAIRLDFADVTALPLDGPFSLLIAHMRWDIRFRSDAPAAVAGRAMGGDNHVVALLHGDRFAGWCEAPDAPISYVRRLYENSARL